jgi:hypothetical protein
MCGVGQFTVSMACMICMPVTGNPFGAGQTRLAAAGRSILILPRRALHHSGQKCVPLASHFIPLIEFAYAAVAATIKLCDKPEPVHSLPDARLLAALH